MHYRTLGKSDLRVPVVSFGAWAVGGWNWGGTDDEAAVRAMQVAVDLGMNAIDTAPVYGFGHSERIVGRAIAGRRDSVVLMTKVGLRWDDTRGDFFFEAVDNDGRKVVVHKNCRPWSVRYEVEQSLTRMGVETLDLVQVHWPDPKTPIAETMGVLADLRREGKLRAIGVSNYSVPMMEEAVRALGDVPLASDQPKYNLVARNIEAEILPFARTHEIGVLVYSPLEQGLLTGEVPSEREFKPDDGRHKRATFSAENRRRVNETLDRVVRPIARSRGLTVGQVVLAWTVAQPGITSALVGARNEAQVRENAVAGDVELDRRELAAIRTAFEALRLDPPFARGGAAHLVRVVRRFLGGLSGRTAK